MSLDWQTAEWADGPKVAAFLDPRVHPSHHPDWFGRAICRWRAGASASFGALDRVLTAADIHPMDLPDDVWRERPANFRTPPPQRKLGSKMGRKLNAAQVFEMRQRYRPGVVTYKQLAAEYGVSSKTVELICRGRTWTEVAA